MIPLGWKGSNNLSVTKTNLLRKGENYNVKFQNASHVHIFWAILRTLISPILDNLQDWGTRQIANIKPNEIPYTQKQKTVPTLRTWLIWNDANLSLSSLATLYNVNKFSFLTFHEPSICFMQQHWKIEVRQTVNNSDHMLEMRMKWIGIIWLRSIIC
jgi:hypothetical protein